MKTKVTKAKEYIMNYKDFKGNECEWTENVWRLFNAKNNNRKDVILLDVLQGGKDENGFYPNFIKLVVTENSAIDWELFLSLLKYDYKIYDVNVKTIFVEWVEDIDEYVVEEW